ncbi:hypothetical protein Tco_1391455 [Tanacetum coccineum]
MAISDRTLNELMDLSGEIGIPKYMRFFFMQWTAKEKAFANLPCDQCDDVRRRFTKLYVMIQEMESLKDRLLVYDTLKCLRETQRRENDKLASLSISCQVFKAASPKAQFLTGGGLLVVTTSVNDLALSLTSASIVIELDLNLSSLQL